jgi:hypothetical protein
MAVRKEANLRLEALSVVIAEIIEDVHADSVVQLSADPDEIDRRIARLHQAGVDTAVLAAAMAVLHRRERNKEA